MHYSFGAFLLYLLWDLRAWGVAGHFLHPFSCSPPHPCPPDVNVLVLSGMFACVAVRSGKKTVLFCENLFFFFLFFLLWFLSWALTVNSMPSFSGFVCSANSYTHCYICPKIFLRVCPSPPLSSTKKKDKTIPSNRKQSFPVLIRGCREGTGSAWVGIGIYTGFYCHLKIHFCHGGILYCMLRLEF